MVEKDEAWLDVQKNLLWFNKGKDFLWLSERDGWRHLYRVSAKTGRQILLTPGSYDIMRILQLNAKKQYLYFTASPDNPTQKYLYRHSLKGSKKPERITPEIFRGTNSYNISPDCRWAVHTYSSYNSPPIVNFIKLPSHKKVRELIKNTKLKNNLARLDKTTTEFFRVSISGNIQLDGWMIKPPDFDPGKRYPVLFNVYGEPAGQTVLDRWRGRTYLWHLMLSQKGYIIASIDNRGTPAPRGRKWRKVVYKKVGLLPSADQAAAVRQMLKERLMLK